MSKKMSRLADLILAVLCAVVTVAATARAAQCTVDPQVTSAASITISQITNTNKVRFMINIPDEVQSGADNIFKTFEFVHGACAFIDWNNVALPTVASTDVNAPSNITDGTNEWKAYRDTSGSCDVVKMFVDLEVSQLLQCLTYTTTDGSGNLLYEVTGITLTRYYSFLLTDATTGVSNSISSASIETQFNYQIAIQTVYSGMTADAAMSISGDPMNPDSVAVFKQVSITATSGNTRTYTIQIATKSLYPFELRTSTPSGIATASLDVTATSMNSAEFSLDARCPTDTTYDADGEQCDQVLTLVVVATACSFTNQVVNFPNNKLYYGCAGGTTNGACPLVDDAATTLGTFTAANPLSITLNSGDRCALGSNTINFAASLSLTAKAVTGLLAGGSTWDTNQRDRTLYNTAGYLYFDVEATNIASITTIDGVIVNGVDIATVDGSPSASPLSGFSAYTSDLTNCNVTVGTGVGSIFRVCLRVPMSLANFPTAPALNGKTSYGFTITATTILKDINTGKRRFVTASSNQEITSKASTSISVLSESAAQTPSTGASASTIAIGATVGVVALAAVAGAIVVAVIAVKAAAAKAAVAAASASASGATVSV